MTTTPVRPNIVLIVADDMPADMLAFMPRTRWWMEDQGTALTRCYAPTPTCSPSRVSILTGQHSRRHGVYNNELQNGQGIRPFLNNQDNSLGPWLYGAGYATGYFGKYINGYGAIANSPATSVPPGWSTWVSGPGDQAYIYEAPFDLNIDGQIVSYQSTNRNTPKPYQPDVLRDLALAFIDRHAHDSGPFFVHFAPVTPHQQVKGIAISDPIPALRHRGMFATHPLPKPPDYNEADVSDKPAAIRGLYPIGNFAEGKIADFYRAQLESLQALDEATDAIFRLLASHGLLDSTLVAFVSDQGLCHGNHRIRSVKKCLYEPASRMAALFRGPGVVHQTSQVLAANTDLAPTFCELAGVVPGRVQDGLSLVPVLAGSAVPLRAGLLLEGADFDYLGVHTGREVYAEHATGEREYYDLVADPHQLVGNTQPPQSVVDLLQQLRSP